MKRAKTTNGISAKDWLVVIWLVLVGGLFLMGAAFQEKMMQSAAIALLMLGSGSAFIGSVIKGVSTGVMKELTKFSRRFDRQKTPGQFWVCVGIHFFLGAVFLFGGLWMAFHLMHR